MSASKILVTGGTGVLGRRVVDLLEQRSVETRVLSRSSRPGTIRGDLLTGDGLDRAVGGTDTVIHCASSPFRKTRQVDVEGTRRLLEATARAGVSHLVYISIVGIDRASSYPYYRIKLETEGVIKESPVPYTILRATQFYDLVLMAMRALDRLPIMPVPRGLLGQPIDGGEVAGRLVEISVGEPAGRAPDIGGPEVRTLTDAARLPGGLRKPQARPAGPAARQNGSGDARRCADVPGEPLRQAPLGGVLARNGPSAGATGEGGAVMTVERKAGAGHGWWLRAGLLFLAFASLLVGPWAQFAPAWFWEGFPGFGRSWVSVDGSYNEHLVRDVGGLQLGMAVVCFAAFLRPGVTLVRAAALASVAWQAPHLVYHFVHVGDLPTLGDRVAQSAGLVITLVVAVAVLVAALRPVRASGGPSGSHHPAE